MRPASHLHFSLNDKIVGTLYLTLLKKALAAEGASSECIELLNNAAPIGGDPKKRIALKDFLLVLEHALNSAPAGIGFRYGKELNLIAADTLGQLVMSCEDLRDAAKVLKDYHLLFGLPCYFQCEDDQVTGRSRISFQALHHPLLPEKIKHFISEALFTAIANQASWLCGEPLNYRALYLPYATPDHLERYNEVFACPCFFDSDEHAIEFDTELFSRSILTANSAIKADKLSRCEAVLLRWEKSFNYSRRIEAVFKVNFPKLPSIEEMAVTLHISKSALHRKLQDEGTSYQLLINKFKQQRSEYYLKHTSFTISEIAERIGFSDSSTFRRAFKAWTGQQPSALRSERA